MSVLIRTAGLLFLVAALLPKNATAQEDVFLQCAHADSDPAATYERTSTPRIGPYGTHRVLTVLVKYRDDDTVNSNFTGWPADAVQTPDFVSGFLDSLATPASFSDSSLTRSFYDQSLSPSGDALTLYGKVYPEVIETDYPEAHYYRVDLDDCTPDDCASQESGHGVLVQEVLEKIDPHVDFSSYDVNNDGVGDGTIDYIYIMIRANPRAERWYWWSTEGNCTDPIDTNRHPLCGSMPRYSGVSNLQAASGTITDTRWPNGVPNLSFDGKSLDWWLGTVAYVRTAFFPHRNIVGLATHEIGHDVWSDKFFSHVAPISPGNDVPANEPPNPTNREKLYGYATMQGGGYGGVGGSAAISAHERAIRGWIQPQELTQTQLDLELPDLRTSGVSFVTETANGWDIRLSNLQRVHPTTKLIRNYCIGTCGTDSLAVYAGQRTTGLLAMLVNGETRIDVLAADNTLESAVAASAYAGDLYSPVEPHPSPGGTLVKTQLTPWTKPNINGFTDYANAPSGFQPVWKAVDNIRYLGDADSTLVFDFYADFRTAPTVVIRADSWMGAETAFAFSSEVRVTAGATLTIEDGADVTFDGSLTVEDGATLRIEPGAAFAVGAGELLLAESGGAVVVAPGAEVTVESGAVVRGASGSQLTLGAGATVRLGEKARLEASALTAVGTEAEPILFTRSNPGDDVWDRVLLTNGPDFAHDLQHVRIEGAAVGLDVQARGSSPGAAGAVLTNVRLVGNDIGLSTDYHDCGGWCAPQRARVWMNHVLVEESATYGLYLRNADFSLSNSTVRMSGGHGVFVKNASATSFVDNVIEGNGTNAGSYDGLRVEANGEVDLNRRGDVVGTGQPGRNRITRNDDHQVAYLSGAYLFMGATGLGGDLNTVTERGTGCRVYNDSGSILEAEGNYWGTTSAPPASYFCGSHSVDANPYLTADSTGGSGGGYRPASGGAVLLASAASAATATANRGGDDDPIALLRARIQTVRAAITEHPSAEVASALVRLLAGLHRLDADDATGEAAATEQVLQALRDHLTEGTPGSLPPGLRRTAESAAVVALEGALAEEDYERADGLLSTFEPVVEDNGHRLALGLSAVSVEEAHERYDVALDRLGALIAEVGDGHDGLAEDLAFLAEVIAAKAETAGRGSDGAGDADAVANRSGDEAALPAAYALLPAYPNPTASRATVPFELPEAAEVEVAVYDLLGRRVAVLAEGLYAAGHHTATLDASGLSAGVYVVRAQMVAQGGAVQAFTQKLTLVK